MKQIFVTSDNVIYFYSKKQLRTIVSKNSCHFRNLFSFASSSLFLSMRKITWLNSQKRQKLEDMFSHFTDQVTKQCQQDMVLGGESIPMQTIKLKSSTISSEEGASQNHITSTACCAGYLIGPCRIEDMGFYSALFLMFF